MARHLPLVLTCAAGEDPLRLVANAAAGRVALSDELSAPLQQWRILLPTRRAVRRLQLLLTQQSGGGVFLPRIEALGDLEEREGGAPYGLARHEQIFGLAGIVQIWARENPQLDLARIIAGSSCATLALARSLAELIDQIETEEADFRRITSVYDFVDLAGHHEAVTGLLGEVRQGYAKLLQDRGCLGPAARRNAMIRATARQIAEIASGPILAAGSTGSNPATRELLKVIANLPQGAVILPGLDLACDDADWLAMTPTHPQWGLKQLLDHMGVARQEVQPMARNAGRQRLVTEVMRPSARTDQWRSSLMQGSTELRQSLAGLHLLEADDRHEEALAIALILREAIETEGQTACLITPDRDLAVRVKAELARWCITIDDSAGDRLVHHGQASLMAAVIHCVQENFSELALLDLLHHRHCNPVVDGVDIRSATRVIDLALRQLAVDQNGSNIVTRLAAIIEMQMLAAVSDANHVHPVVGRIAPEEWQGAGTFAAWLAEIFSTLDPQHRALLKDHAAQLVAATEMLSPGTARPLTGHDQFNTVLKRLSENSDRLGAVPLLDGAAIIRDLLGAEVIHQACAVHPRLAIYGLAEARMMQADVVILGGLTEGAWPAQPDTGPWVNRAMREALGLSAPERDIGLTAHDFAEGLSFRTVYVSWSKRLGLQPAVPSRWVMRLRMLMSGLGIQSAEQLDGFHVGLARRIDRASGFTPVSKPHPKPPVAARPRRYSITDITKLIRDPYAIHAAKILRFKPLPALGASRVAAFRGSLFHSVLEKWNKGFPYQTVQEAARALEEAGRAEFAALPDNPQIKAFWWPRLKRVAQELPVVMSEYDRNVVRVLSEISGEMRFQSGSHSFTLSGRIDRADIFADGSARIIDYKTGDTPSLKQVVEGNEPQLTLSAHMMLEGAFNALGMRPSHEALYVKVGGGRNGVEVTRIAAAKDNTSFATLAQRTFERAKELLARSLDPAFSFEPRLRIEKLRDISDYDHLSRFLEWQLAEDR